MDFKGDLEFFFKDFIRLVVVIEFLFCFSIDGNFNLRMVVLERFCDRSY